MIYLLVEIFVYLLAALALGFGAGWLWRNLQAAGRESAAERVLFDSRSRQMETALRTAEQRLQTAQAQLEARELELEGQAERLAARDRAVTELEGTCAELRAALEWATAPAPANGTGEGPGQRDAGPSAAGDAAGDDGRPALAPAPGSAEDVHRRPQKANRELETARRELEDARAAGRQELERLQRALAAEERRVAELTRERELQRGALAALEQQLELAREGQSRRAHG